MSLDPALIRRMQHSCFSRRRRPSPRRGGANPISRPVSPPSPPFPPPQRISLLPPRLELPTGKWGAKWNLLPPPPLLYVGEREFLLLSPTHVAPPPPQLDFVKRSDFFCPPKKKPLSPPARDRYRRAGGSLLRNQRNRKSRGNLLPRRKMKAAS